ncbi:MAG: HTTM domain-containing protein [Acidimicrobiales bacterium]
MRALQRFFFEPQTTAPMALVRVAWGAVMTIWALTLLPDVDPFLTTGALRYEQPGAAGSWNPLDVISWSGAPLVTCFILIAAAAAVTVGYRTRATTVVAVLCLISLQRTNATIFNSGDLFLRQIGFAVALSPCGLLWSVDARRARRHGRDIAPWRAPWGMRLLQLEVAIGYFLSGWAKARGQTWRDGRALELALRIEDLQRVRAPEWIFGHPELLDALTTSTVAFECAFLFLVWNRRLRPWVLGIGVAFHLGIDIFLDVGFFSIAMWVAYLAFIFPPVAAQIVRRFDPTGVGSPDRGAEAVPLAVQPAQ